MNILRSIALLFVPATVTAFSPQEKLIYNGEHIDIESMPHSVAILMFANWPEDLTVCSGSILDHRWVMTAAHCPKPVYNQPNIIKLRFGIDSYNQEGPIIDVKKIVCHKGYRSFWIRKDICLLQTFDEIPFSDRVQPVALPLPEEKLDSVTDVRVAGWGFLDGSHGNGIITTYLAAVDLPILGFVACDGHFEVDLKLEDPGTFFCAGAESIIPKTACQGDSGSAAVIKRSDNQTWVAMGITVFGKCQGPVIFIPVSLYLDWIGENLKENS